MEAGVTADIFDARTVLRDPNAAAGVLRGATLDGLSELEIVRPDRNCVIFHLTLAPWWELSVHGYPVERVSILVWQDGRIAAIPPADERPWLHRADPPLKPLCLWFPGDPRALRWEWDDGLVAYVAIVHRHLQAEECWRRHGEWPAEDAPHGEGNHPIRSALLRHHAQGQEAP